MCSRLMTPAWNALRLCDVSARHDKAVGHCRTCGSGGDAAAIFGKLGAPRLCRAEGIARPRPRAGAAACLHARHPVADGGAVLHALDAAPQRLARTGRGGRTARLRGPLADAGLPARAWRRHRHLAQRRARPLRQPGLPLSRPPVHGCGRSVPLPDRPAGPLYGPHPAYPCEGAGQGHPRAHHAGLFPGPRRRQCPRFDFPGRPAGAPRPDRRRRLSSALPSGSSARSALPGSPPRSRSPPGCRRTGRWSDCRPPAGSSPARDRPWPHLPCVSARRRRPW